MNLFELKDYNVTFSPEALILIPFKILWDRDKTKNKKIAISELSYVYFMCDYKSDYADIIDEFKRSKEIISVLVLPEKWKPDENVMKAMQFYKERSKGMIMHLYEAATILLDQIVKFAKEVDLNERDDKGKPIHNLKQINDVVKQLGDSVESVQNLEKMVKAELTNNKDKIGSKTKSMFEDGFKLA